MRNFCLVILVMLWGVFCCSPSFAEDELEGFVITPQSVEFALYDHLLSPSSLNVTMACVGTRVIFEEKIADETHTYICNFDCDNTSFEWQIVSEKPWVRFIPSRGDAKTLKEIRVTIDKDYLRNVPPQTCGDTPCFSSDVTFRITYYLEDCREYSENGSNTASVVHYSKKTFSDFVRVYYSPAGASPRVNPTKISFRAQIDEDSTDGTTRVDSLEFQPVKVQVLAGYQGWDYTSAAPWLSISKEEKTSTEGFLEIQPSGLDVPGRYRGYVKVRDRGSGRTSSLKVTVDVLSSQTGIANLFYALFPDGSYRDQVNLLTAQWLNIQVYLGSGVASLPVYVEATHSAFPDYVFAYRWETGGPSFVVASYKGETVPEVDNFYYAPTGIEEIHIGGFRLAYLPGIAHLRVKQGSSWSNSKTILDIELLIQGLSGSWKIVDTYNETEYEHPSLLEVSEGLEGLLASWGEYRPVIRYGTSPAVLYEILFNYRDFNFRYQINHLEAGYLSGVWSYSSDGVQFSAPQPFYGIKLIP